MVDPEDLARTAMAGNALMLRSMAQEWIAATTDFSAVAPPKTNDPTLRAVAAGFVELFAMRRNLLAPAWTAEVPPAPQPVYLVRDCTKMVRLRHLCETESPAPLRRRQIFAPPNYLTFA